MKQTAVEFLLENIEILIKQGHTFNPIFKYYFIEQAKEMEKEQQGYTKSDMNSAWKVSEQNMRSQFSSSAYKGVTFEQWFNEFKNK